MRKPTLKAKRQYVRRLSTKNITSNKKFWDAFKSFFPNKITKSNDFISTKPKWKLVENIEELVEVFNTFFVKAVENAFGLAPASLGGSSKPQNDKANVKNIICEYRGHPVILRIKEIETFIFPKASPTDINKIIH